ncbi:MAG: hypothetical protein LBU75_01980 [Desulfovibrio sp.]|jgi:hypothetical protein|nr:hypothetical protein [Desulfovibrio sp.]
MSSASDFSSSLSACAGDPAKPEESGPDLGELLASTPGIIPVGDAAFAAAYEATGDVDRARLKTCIARLHVLQGGGGAAGDVLEGRVGRTATRWRQGFTSIEHAAPCVWALICVDATWPSAPRLLAAVLPALFAGVGGVAVLRVGGSGQWPASVLAALELAGQEVVADVAPEALPALLEGLSANGGLAGRDGAGGRLVLLGDHPDGISARARSLGVSVWRDGPAPVIGIVEDADAIAPDDRLNVPALRSAHPDATFLDIPAAPSGATAPGFVPQSTLPPLLPLTAIACAPDQASGWLDHAALVLGPGHEWCWMHPGLSPVWFARRAVALLPASPPADLPGLP